ncbi:MAG: Thioredoxin reductase [Chlamydiae bacterium]|nr:Thioredoxin reductase [Chlamydiota bacterium]
MKRFLYSILIFLLSGLIPAFSTEEEKQSSSPQAVVIGGGIGALTSAIYLQRAGIDTLVIEGKTPGGAIAQSPMVHNWPGEIQINGSDLADKVRKQAEANGAKFLSHEVIDVDFSKKTFTIKTRDIYDEQETKTIQTKACIIAVGSVPRFLGVKGESGEKGYWTKGVYSCAVCDGGLYKDRTVAVVGGGDSAVIEADYLSNIAKKVYLILRSDKFRTVEIMRKNKLLKKGNVEVIYNTKVQEIEGDGQKVTHLNLSSSKQLPVDGIFLAIGATPNSDVFKKQVAVDEKGYIRLAKGQQTSVPGVFAIGDVVDPFYKQAVSAAGDGAKAALQVEHYLASMPKDSSESIPDANKQIVLAQNATTEGTLKKLTSQEEFYQAIGENSTPLVVGFFSPYCGPCQTLTPKLEAMAEKYAGKIRFLKVDVTHFSELASTYNVYGVPSVIVFNKKGKAVERGVGLDEINPILKKMEAQASQ